MENLFFSTDCADLVCKEDTNGGCYMHSHKMIELIYYVDGTHTAVVNNHSRQMTADCISVTNPYEPHFYTSSDNGRLILMQLNDLYLMQLRALFPDIMFENFLTDREVNRQILREIRLLISEENAHPLLKSSIVNKILYLIAAHYSADRSGVKSVVQQALEYIYTNYEKNLTRDSLSKVFGYNPVYFAHIFKQSMGMSLTTYINVVRYNAVQNKLAENGGKNKTTTILNAGFSSTLNYYRFVKKLKDLGMH